MLIIKNLVCFCRNCFCRNCFFFCFCTVENDEIDPVIGTRYYSDLYNHMDFKKISNITWPSTKVSIYKNFLIYLSNEKFGCNFRNLKYFLNVACLSFNVIKHYWSQWEKTKNKKFRQTLPRISIVINAISKKVLDFVELQTMNSGLNDLDQIAQKLKKAQHAQMQSTIRWTKFTSYQPNSFHFDDEEDDDDDEDEEEDIDMKENDDNDGDGDGDDDGDNYMKNNEQELNHNRMKRSSSELKSSSSIRIPQQSRKRRKSNQHYEENKYKTEYFLNNHGKATDCFNEIIPESRQPSSSPPNRFADLWFPETHDDKKKFCADPKTGFVLKTAFIKCLNDSEKAFLTNIHSKNKPGLFFSKSFLLNHLL